MSPEAISAAYISEIGAISVAVGCFVSAAVMLATTTRNLRRNASIVAALVFAVTACYYALSASWSTYTYCEERGVGSTRYMRSVQPLRYMFWTVTTPPIVAMLGQVGRARPHHIARAAVADIICMVSGLISAMTQSSIASWAVFFAIATLADLYVCVALVRFMHGAFHAGDARVKHVILVMAPLALIMWLTFPIAWLLAEFNVTSPAQEMLFYSILDVVAKVAFTQVMQAGDYQKHESELEQDIEEMDRERKAAEASNATKRLFMRYIFHEIRVPLNTLALGIDDLSATLVDLNTALPQSIPSAVETPMPALGSAATSTPLPARVMPDAGALAVMAARAATGRALETVDILSAASMGMTKLLDDFLSLEKIEEGAMEMDVAPFRVNDVVSVSLHTFSKMLQRKRVRVTQIASPDLPMALGDSHRIAQVVNNLISNAVKFCKEGGKITVKVELLAPRAIAGSRRALTQNAASKDAIGPEVVDVPVSTSMCCFPCAHADATPAAHAAVAPAPPASVVQVVPYASPARLPTAGATSVVTDVQEGSFVGMSSAAYTPRVNTAVHAADVRSQDSSRRSSTNSNGVAGDLASPAHGPLAFNPPPGLQPAAMRSGSDTPTAASPTAGTVVPLATLASLGLPPPSLTAASMPPLLDTTATVATAAASSLAAPVAGSTGRMIRVSVMDDGVGISHTDQARLFKPFVQIRAGALQKGGGTGLGLSICKKIIELSGGSIGVSSKEGAGSTFYFTLPVAAPPDLSSSQTAGGVGVGAGASGSAGTLSGSAFLAMPVIQPTASTSGSGSITRVNSREVNAGGGPSPSRATSAAVLAQPHLVPLRTAIVVDDIPGNRLLFGRLLERKGVTHIHYAANGEETLALVSGMTPEAREAVQLYALDKEMPVMDGHETARQLRKMGITAAIVGVTGNALEEDNALFIASGANAVITKPVRLPQLVAALANLGICLDADGVQPTPAAALAFSTSPSQQGEQTGTL